MAKKKKFRFLKPVLIISTILIVLLVVAYILEGMYLGIVNPFAKVQVKTGLDNLDCRSKNKVPVTAGLDGLNFQSKDDKKRIQTLNMCIQNFSKSGWQNHTNFYESGNFYRSTWCNGSDEKKVKSDIHSITLFTTNYKLPEVYGVGLDIRFKPSLPGWGVIFKFANNIADRVAGNILQIDFIKYNEPNGSVSEKVYVGSGDSYKIYDSVIRMDSSASLEKDLLDYTTSAVSMRDNALAQIKNFRQKVSSEIASNQVEICEYKPSERSNLPPVCVKKRSLTEIEKLVELKKANDYFNSQEDLLNSFYREMYDVLVKTVPLKNCLY